MKTKIKFKVSPKKSKYRNIKCEMDGFKFDSVKEMNYYVVLKLQRKSGAILNFEVKPRIELQSKFNSDGKAIRAIFCEPDYLVHHDGYTEFVDTKGKWTSESKIKWKMLMFKYRETNYKFRII